MVPEIRIWLRCSDASPVKHTSMKYESKPTPWRHQLTVLSTETKIEALNGESLLHMVHLGHGGAG